MYISGDRRMEPACENNLVTFLRGFFVSYSVKINETQSLERTNKRALVLYIPIHICSIHTHTYIYRYIKVEKRES